MLALSNAQFANVNRAAELVAPRARASFMQHVAAQLESVCPGSDIEFTHILCEALGHYGVAVGRSFFASNALHGRRPMGEVPVYPRR